MIKRIHIKGYKSLEDVEVHLQPLTVLFGPNASGKSNFLDALQLLSRIATSSSLREAFGPPYRGKPLESFTFGREGVAGLRERESVRFSLETDIELSQAAVDATVIEVQDRLQVKGRQFASDQPDPDGSLVRERYLRYGVEVEMQPSSGIALIADEYFAALTPAGDTKEDSNAFIGKTDTDGIYSIYDPSADVAGRVVGPRDSSLLTWWRAEDFPHAAALRRELASWLFFYFEPRERMRAPTPLKEVRHIGLMGEELPAFFYTLRATNEKQFDAVVKALRMLVPSISDVRLEVNSEGDVELSVVEDGKPVSSRLLSEGTLRILGLLSLAGMKDPPALVGFEEPENGIHPGRIRLIAEMLKTKAFLGETQMIVTTHSAILPDMLPSESLYVCRKEEGRTSIEPLSAYGPLGRQHAIDDALENKDSSLPVSQRILRGDFDA